MVREDNIKLMSKVAMYEKHQGKKEIPMNSFYKWDYARINALGAVVNSTIAFVLVAAIVIIYKMDYFLANILKMDYKRLGIRVAVVYCVWIALYWLVAMIMYARKYEKARPNIIIYNHDLKKLNEVAQMEMMKSKAIKSKVPVSKTSKSEAAKSKGGVVIDDDFIDF